MYNLMVIDDDVDLLLINRKYFTKEGYRVETAETPGDALKILKNFKPDCIILDVMLPVMSGFELYPKIRAITHAPIIFLSGRTGEKDRVGGLLLGGGDYLIKPYSLRELSARVQIQIRNAVREVTPTISFPPLTLDILAHKVYYKDAEILLSNVEYQLLYLLASRAGQPVSFAEIGSSLWGAYMETDRKTIMVSISRLRKKLEDYDGLENIIETVWSSGYKFVGPRGRV